MTQSTTYPTRQKLQGGILLPCNVKTLDRPDDEGIAYEYDLIRLERGDIPPLSEQRALVAQRLNSDLQAHIYAAYDQGTQSTLQAYMARATRLGRTDIVDACESVFDWIDAVLGYYDTAKTAIFAAIDEAALASVAWDFAADVPPVGLLGWRDIREMF